MALTQENGPFILYESDIAVVSSVITLTGLDVTKVVGFAGIRFFSDVDGTPAVATGGTIQFEVRTINSAPTWENILGGLLQLTDAPETVAWEANTQEVRATPVGVLTATHYCLVVTLNNGGGLSR